MEINKSKIRRYVLVVVAGLFISQIISSQRTNWSLLTPELAGTLRLGIAVGDESKWFSDFDKVKEKISDNEIKYVLKDKMISTGEVVYIIRSLKDSKGAVMQLSFKNMPENLKLVWGYGGASNKKVAKNWVPQIIPADCDKNVFSIEGNSFTLYYGTSRKLKILEAEVPQGEKLKLGDAYQQDTPLQLLSSGKKTKAHMCTSEVQIDNDTPLYFCFYFLNPHADYNYYMLPELFNTGSYKVNKETEWMKSTPD